jgi:hypothetical protein
MCVFVITLLVPVDVVATSYGLNYEESCAKSPTSHGSSFVKLNFLFPWMKLSDILVSLESANFLNASDIKVATGLIRFQHRKLQFLSVDQNQELNDRQRMI